MLYTWNICVYNFGHVSKQMLVYIPSSIYTLYVFVPTFYMFIDANFLFRKKLQIISCELPGQMEIYNFIIMFSFPSKDASFLETVLV